MDAWGGWGRWGMGKRFDALGLPALPALPAPNVTCVFDERCDRQADCRRDDGGCRDGAAAVLACRRADSARRGKDRMAWGRRAMGRSPGDDQPRGAFHT